METTLYLMRHGEVHNPEQILYGRRPGFYLSETGIEQAQAAGRWLADKPITAVYTSPMERAQQTAGFVAEYHAGLRPKTDARLIEVLTPYEGQPTSELAEMGWDLYTGNQPPFESPARVLQRVLDFFEFIRLRHKGESIVAVGHGDILVFSWLHAHGFAPEALMKDNLRKYKLPVDYPATASILTFSFANSMSGGLPRANYHCPY